MDLDPPLIGFDRELSRIRNAIERRESLLVLGARGSGKTALLRAALRQAGPHAVLMHSAPVLHDLLINLARALPSPVPRPEARTSLNLKGLLWTAIEKNPVTVLLDEIQGGGARNYRFLQRIFYMKGAAIIAAARNYRSLDALGRLFFDPRMVLNVPALTQLESNRLFNELARQLHLAQLDIGEFKRQVLEAARGNPGEIVEMCKLAAQPQYQHGSRIKFAPLRIDALINLGILDERQRLRNRFRAQRYAPLRTAAERQHDLIPRADERNHH